MAHANGNSALTQNGPSSKIANKEDTPGGLGRGTDASKAWSGVVSMEDKDAAINMLPNTDNHSCDGCGKDITGHCYMRCAECKSAPEVGDEAHDIDLCSDCFSKGAEPFDHHKTHAYRVMHKLQEKIFTEDWTAAEELALLDLTRKMGLGAWDDIVESKVFYRKGKQAGDIYSHYMDTYLCQYGSVLPPHYLNRREDGTVEKVPIPLTDPQMFEPPLRGTIVSCGEIKSRTIAELSTNPQYKYQPSWDALARKRQDQARKEAKAAKRAAAASGGGSSTPPPPSSLANGNMNGVGDSMDVDGSDDHQSGAASTSTPTGVPGATSSAGGGAAAGAPSAADSGDGTAGARGEMGANGSNNGVDDGGGSGLSSEAFTGSGGDAEAMAAAAAAGKAEQNKRKKNRQERLNKNKQQERDIKEWVEKLPGADLGGYYPLRGDFDHEHDNAAEELLANMEFRPTDHATEKQLKLDVIAVYNHRLDEREKRKRFVVEHNLLDYKKQPCGSKKRLKEDRELIARLRPFARFHKAEEHEELIDNLILARKMRARIEQLQMYRENGITTLAEGQEFDLAKKRRQEELLSKKHRESASYLYDGHANSKGTTRDRNNRYSNRNRDGSAVSDGNGDGGDGTRGSNLMDLTGAPGVEFLSPAERLLCSQLHLLPGYYLVIKDAMIQECARAGCLKRKNISSLALLDAARLDKMYDFFTTCGWVSEQPQDFQYSNNNNNNGLSA